MIVSHKHRFIFLHSRKTAGSSVSLSLLRYLDRDDCWFNAPAHGIMVDALRSGFVPPPATHPAVLAVLESRHGADFVRTATEAPERLNQDERMAFAQAYNSLQLPHPMQGGWQHVSAAEARRHLGDEVWGSYLTFSFERNPWDRMASLYWWRVRGDRTTGPTLAFRDFIKAMHSGDARQIRANKAANNSNWHIYTIDDKLAVDHLGRYEDLSQDLQHVMGRAAVPFDGWLPRSKHRTRKGGPEDLYDSETVELVGEIFHREISLLGYRPPV